MKEQVFVLNIFSFFKNNENAWRNQPFRMAFSSLFYGIALPTFVKVRRKSQR